MRQLQHGIKERSLHVMKIKPTEADRFARWNDVGKNCGSWAQESDSLASGILSSKYHLTAEGGPTMRTSECTSSDAHI